MIDVLNNVTAPDNAATTASTLDQTTQHRRAVVDVFNSGIYWQVKSGNSRSDADWTPASGTFMAPGSRRIPSEGLIFGFRFWAATKAANLPTGGKQAQVTVTLT